MKSDLSKAPTDDRRGFLSILSGLAMVCGLAAGYGKLAELAARFLYPSSGHNVGWQFVALAADLAPGDSMDFTTPSGATMVIARQVAKNSLSEEALATPSADQFIALSSVCPHLGCQVHWQLQRERFFCPCHNGAFDAQGLPIAGPPLSAGQSLSRFPVKVEQELLYVEAPLENIGSSSSQASRVAPHQTVNAQLAACWKSDSPRPKKA